MPWLVLLLFSAAAAVALREECQVANWYDYKDTLVGEFNEFIDMMQYSNFVRDMLKRLDPIRMNSTLLKKEKKSFLGYDYEISTTLESLSVSGLTNVYLKFVNISSPTNLVSGAYITGNLTGNAVIKFHLEQLTKSGCQANEEQFLGLCYLKCSILTSGTHPLRTAFNTCARAGCDSTEDKSNGLCYPKCREKYSGLGPVCWGSCRAFYGSKYKDTGLTCHRFWPPHSKIKPSYGRGVGRLPHAPWTRGFGCNGFGVNSSGGCATPFHKLCFTEALNIKSGPCKPRTFTIKAALGLTNPSASVDSRLVVMRCQGDLLKNKEACENVSAAGLLRALVRSKNETDEYVKKIYKRVKEFNIDTISFEFDQISHGDLVVHTNGRPIGKAFTKFILDIARSILNNHAVVKEFVVSKLAEVSENLVNDEIEEKMAPWFGSSCYDDRR